MLVIKKGEFIKEGLATKEELIKNKQPLKSAKGLRADTKEGKVVDDILNVYFKRRII